MKTMMVSMIVSLGFLFTTVSDARAAYCPVSSSFKRSTTNPRCRCRRGVKSRTATIRYKRKHSLSSSKAKRWARSYATKIARARCRKSGSKLLSFTSRVLRYRNKNTMGFNSGYVTIRYRCAWRQVRFYRDMRTGGLSRKVYTTKGRAWWRKKGVGSKRNACRNADNAAKRNVAKRYKAKVVSYRRTGYRRRKRPFYVKCTVRYIARFRKYVPQRRFRCW